MRTNSSSRALIFAIILTVLGPISAAASAGHLPAPTGSFDSITEIDTNDRVEGL
jgi:hypothetical protein